MDAQDDKATTVGKTRESVYRDLKRVIKVYQTKEWDRLVKIIKYDCSPVFGFFKMAFIYFYR